MQVLLPRHASHANQGYVQKDAMAADFALLGVDSSNNSDGLFVAGQLEGFGYFDADNPDHLLLPVYLLLCALRKEDTQEVLPVHTLLIVYPI
jgi:hypothetical protein